MAVTPGKSYKNVGNVRYSGNSSKFSSSEPLFYNRYFDLLDCNLVDGLLPLSSELCGLTL